MREYKEAANMNITEMLEIHFLQIKNSVTDVMDFIKSIFEPESERDIDTKMFNNNPFIQKRKSYSFCKFEK